MGAKRPGELRSLPELVQHHRIYPEHDSLYKVEDVQECVAIVQGYIGFPELFSVVIFDQIY